MDATTMSIISGLVLLITFALVGWRSARRDAERLRRHREADASSDQGKADE